jgi:hypothetical protein
MSNNVNSLLASVPKLKAQKKDGSSGNTYQDWKFAISMVFRRAGCYHIIDTPRPSTRDAAEKWDAQAEEMLTAIGLTIDPSQYQYIDSCKTGVEAWEKLKKIYEKNSRANRIALKRQFYGYNHDPAKPIQEYISGITGLASRLKAIGVKLEDTDIMDVLLWNLDSSWTTIAASLSATTDDLDSIEHITGALMDEEGRRAGIDDPSYADTSLVAKSHKFPNSSAGSRKCFRCQKEGHIASHCTAPAPVSAEAANIAQDVLDEEYAY